MKINKTLIILSLLLIFCISLSAVSAADDTDMSVNDINDVATVESSVNDDEINTVSEGEIHNSSEIYDNISSAIGTYNITEDYQIDTTWNISNANVIIEGNNHTIYGNGKRAFNISANNVTIKNLNFKDCSFNGDGGAIYFNSLFDSCVEDCNFVNCSASGSGGAIFFSGHSSVSGCSFVNCSSKGMGGAIFFYTGAPLVNCSFVNCSSESMGGAINILFNSGFTKYCNFINCSANVSGGAISVWNGGSLNVSYCIFDNDKAENGIGIRINNGVGIRIEYNFFGFPNNVSNFPDNLICYELDSPPVIQNWVVLNIVKSGDDYVVKFVDNHGYNLLDFMSDYNAIFTVNKDTKGITIKNNRFNGAFVNGIYKLTNPNAGNLLVDTNFGDPDDSFTALSKLISNDTTVELTHNYTFYEDYDKEFVNGIIIEDNVVINGNGFTIDGSNLARVFNITGNNVNIENITFVGCSVGDNGSYGGAIYFGGSGSVGGCSFVNCSANMSGGAIYIKGSGSVGGCSFVDCSASDYGSAIYITNGSDNGVVGGCSFVNCSTRDNGGAIYWASSDGSVVGGCSFVNCSTRDNGGAIYWASSDGSVVSGCSFVNCSAGSKGSSAIAFASFGSQFINYCVFDNNKGMYTVFGSSGTSLNYNFFGFQNNVTTFPSGLVWKSTVDNWVVLNISKVNNSYLVNFVLNNGSTLDEFMPDYTALLNINGDVKEITIQNNTFNDTWVIGDYLLNSINSGNVLVTTSFPPVDSFRALNDLTVNSKNNTIILNHNYKFYDAVYERFKDGIPINKNNLVIDGNGFTIDGSNLARVFNVTGDNVTIKNINFINTNSSLNGSAIYCGGADGVVSGCSFVNCSVSGSGGAIYCGGADGVVSGCSFVNCSVSGSGSAIYIPDGSVNYCIFDNNKANEGSAIYTTSFSVNVDYNFFGFQNNVTKFPMGLVYCAYPNYWVVLNISEVNNSYFVKFVTDECNSLSENMLDYTACLVINGVTKDIIIKNNTYNDTYVLGNYVVTSLNSGNVLANVTFNNNTNCSMNVSVNDTLYGEPVSVVVTLPTDAIGYVEFYI